MHQPDEPKREPWGRAGEPPASEPMVWLKLARLSVARLATVNAPLDENALVAPAASVPALMA
jgi:hypothetical protein